jgi:hypothetical protein
MSQNGRIAWDSGFSYYSFVKKKSNKSFKWFHGIFTGIRDSAS